MVINYNFYLMINIEYEIQLDENGRPYIKLGDNYDSKPEDKFFAIELARYFLERTHILMTPEKYDQHTINTMDIAIRLLGQIGDELAMIQFENMKAQGEFSLMLNNNYNIRVNSIEERDALPEKNIIYDNKLFDRVEGLKVYCRIFNKETYEYENETFELVDGITNEHWKKL